MTSFPQDVYARNLLSHRGYPLWTPEPNIELPESYQQEGLKIGDVGVVVPEEGSFDVFFNITLPPTHPLHTSDGVPDLFTPILLKRKDYRVTPDAESPGRVITSENVECSLNSVDPFHVDGTACSLTEHRFRLSQDQGAMLILPQGAQRHRLAKPLLLLDIILSNAVEWYRFARESLYRDISSDALYLITGFHKVPSWSLASFEKAGACFAQCKVVQSRQGGPMLPDDSSWESSYPLEWRIGPRCSTGSPNQSVFIVGFKIAINEELLHLKRITVKTQYSSRTVATTLVGFGACVANILSMVTPFQVTYPNSDPGAQDEEASVPAASHDLPEDEERSVRVEHIPKLLKPFHPCDVINHYMLKKMSSAKVAVTHDNQWIALLDKGILNEQDMLCDERLIQAVSQEYTIVFQNDVVLLQSVVEPTGTDAQEAAPAPDPPEIGSLGLITQGISTRMTKFLSQIIPRPMLREQKKKLALVSRIDGHYPKPLPPKILIGCREEPFYDFTNFSPRDIVYKTKRYPTGEHLFQALKFMDDHPWIAERIRNCGERAMLAFDEAHRFQKYVHSDWRNKRIEKMEVVLHLKFSQHRDLRILLLSTGDARLIADSPRDYFWGIGADHSGRNEFGEALMRVRELLSQGGDQVNVLISKRGTSEAFTQGHDSLESKGHILNAEDYQPSATSSKASSSRLPLEVTRKASSGELCEFCQTRPKFQDHPYCGRTCATQATKVCMYCRKKPRFGKHPYCSRTCATKAGSV